jgi:hypothetical protein
MKQANKILIGTFALAMLFTIVSVNTALAADTSVEINADQYQTRIQANNRVMFTFRQRTRLCFDTTVNIDVDINCDAMAIGVKSFEIEVECEQDMAMNMTCTEEQVQLGLLMGNRYTIRNRHRYLYQEGFCVSLKSNNSGDIQAKLKIEANNKNRFGTWAYYDEASEEWVSVPTTIEDGYLVAETDHFSYWTILIPESDGNFGFYLGLIGIIGILAIISVMYLRKRA